MRRRTQFNGASNTLLFNSKQGKVCSSVGPRFYNRDRTLWGLYRSTREQVWIAMRTIAASPRGGSRSSGSRICPILPEMIQEERATAAGIAEALHLRRELRPVGLFLLVPGSKFRPLTR